ncbi:MAG: HlyD family efflux transporter periplasmic adaptor subunit [Labilithrix sp.]|nr:HlyD family efflux transporter periplasmic adaptor subunit [Labilithrix sp.]
MNATVSQVQAPRPRAKVVFLLAGVALAVTVATVAWAIAAKRARAPEAEAASAPVAMAVTPAADDDITWPGVLLAPASVDLAPTIDGRIAEVRFKTGDRVEKDAIVAVLDDRQHRDELAVAEAGRRAASADAVRARIELSQARDRQVRRDATVKVDGETLQVVSAEEAAQARFATQAAVSRAAAAGAGAAERSARARQLKTALAETQLRAPFAGIVAARYGDVGAFVRPGQPVLRIIATSDLRVRFAVSEEQARKVAVGHAITVSVDERLLSAVVETVAPEVEPASRTVFVEGSLRGAASDGAVASLAGRVVRVRLGARP